MKTLYKINNSIKQLTNKELELENELNKIKQKKKKLNEELLVTCIKNKTHNFERVFEYLSYGETEYKCNACGLYK